MGEDTGCCDKACLKQRTLTTRRASVKVMKMCCCEGSVSSKLAICEVDFSTMRQASIWAALFRCSVAQTALLWIWYGPEFLNVKNTPLLLLLLFNIMGKNVITANPCGVCGISWPVRIYIAFMYSMNWAQVLLPTVVVFSRASQ